MSRVILGWQLNRRVEDQDIAAIIARIKARYQPLFADPIHHAGIWHENQGLLCLDVVPREDPGVHLDSARIICLNGSPSITGHASSGRARLLDAKQLHDHIHHSSGRVDPSTLHQVNPPFTLCWFDKERQELGLAHDGLGADQFFMAETSKGMAFSNRCWPILQFLDEAPRIDHAAWRYWFGLGWFPENSTPFENVRHLGPGELIRADSRVVRFGSEDTLTSWIKPPEEEFPNSLTMAATHSFEQLIRLNTPSSVPYAADLTGGLDSRAICSYIIKEGLPCTFLTGGPRYSSDVVVARRIARQFHLDWEHVRNPPFGRDRGLPQVVDVQFMKLLLWGEGLVEPSRFLHFQVGPAPTTQGGYLEGGSGEISKGHYYDCFKQFGDQEYRQALSRLERISAPLSDADGFDLTRLMRDQVAKGVAYGLRDFALLDFFYLNERTRRWQSAHRAINLFDRSVMPFVNIEHVTLALAMRPIDKAQRRFQRFIIAQNVAGLLPEEFRNRGFEFPDRLLRLLSRTGWLGAVLKTLSWADYLRGIGKPQVDRIFASDSPLWQILDRGKATAKWNAFLQGSDQSLQFPLGLMAFGRWYTMYFDST